VTIDIPIQRCFVALFDILGYAELIKTSGLRDVFSTYEKVKKKTVDMQDALSGLDYSITVRAFSDTFLFYTSDTINQRPEKIDEAFLALLAICEYLFIAANQNKLPIRGAITEGKLIVTNGIEIGQPIVDAYKMEQKQEWIGCWVAQACIRRISQAALQENLQEKAIVKYNIPLKEGSVKKVYAFNWVQSGPSQVKDFHFLEKKKGHDWSVERKHKNTWEFIKFIQKLTNVPLFVSLLFICAACTAQMVNAPGGMSDSPYAPVNEASRSGVIKYLNGGADAVIKSRREDAYKKMYDACNGKYRIDAEGPREEGGVVMGISPSSSVYANSEYWYIQFSCVKD